MSGYTAPTLPISGAIVSVQLALVFQSIEKVASKLLYVVFQHGQTC